MQSRDTLGDDAETGSVMSSTFSLGEPLETASTQSVAEDPDVDAEFSKVVAGIQDTTISEPNPDISRRPSRPHHSAQEDHVVDHPLSETTTETTQDAASEELLEVPLNQCLFCNAPSDDITSNVLHMSKQHGMFIPESDYLVDLEGLLGYLHEKINDFHECLYCGQMKHTVSGVQTHMRDRGHCMIPYSTETEMLDIGEFYDFRGTYSDDEETDEDMEDVEQDGGVKLGATRATKITVDKGTGEGDEEMVDDDDEGWESDASSLSSVPTDEITSVPIDDHSHRYKTLDKHRHHSHKDPRPHRSQDGFHSHAHATPHAVYHDDYELHLPSGRTAGHRSLRMYYRQNLRNYPTPTEREQRMIEGRHDSDNEDAQNSRQRDRGRQIVSRANGGLGMVGVSDAKKREAMAVEKRTTKQAQRAQAQYQWGNNKRSNFQKHFRVSPRVSFDIDMRSDIPFRTLCFSSRSICQGTKYSWSRSRGLALGLYYSIRLLYQTRNDQYSSPRSPIVFLCALSCTWAFRSPLVEASIRV